MTEINTIIINAETGEITETYVEQVEQTEYVITYSDYENLVDQKIRQRYTVSQELAILRQRDAKSDEWLDYYNYCEECKTNAKTELDYEEISGITE